METYEPRKTRKSKRRKITLAIFVLVMAVLFIYGIDGLLRGRGVCEADCILHSPNLNGRVFGHMRVPYYVARVPRIDPPVTTYRLRIIGVYNDGDKRISIDQYFNVTAEMYYRHEIGDVFSSTPP